MFHAEAAVTALAERYGSVGVQGRISDNRCKGQSRTELAVYEKTVLSDPTNPRRRRSNFMRKKRIQF